MQIHLMDEPEYLDSLRPVVDLYQEWWGFMVKGTKLDGRGERGDEKGCWRSVLVGFRKTWGNRGRWRAEVYETRKGK